MTFAPISPVRDKSSLNLGKSAMLITIHGLKGTLQPLILRGSRSRSRNPILLLLEEIDPIDRLDLVPSSPSIL